MGSRKPLVVVLMIALSCLLVLASTSFLYCKSASSWSCGEYRLRGCPQIPPEPMETAPRGATPKSGRNSSIHRIHIPPRQRGRETRRPVPFTKCKRASVRPHNTLPLAALNSYPGSGNTWLRYLIERATGISTGSIYCDKALKKGGFVGECKRATCGCTVVVKIHHIDGRFKAYPWQRGILLMRNPYDALIAEYNRLKGRGHVKHAPRTTFWGSDWKKFCSGHIRLWSKILEDALQVFGPNILVVHFEDLVSDLDMQLPEIVNFLGIDEATVKERLRCTLDHPEGKFKRKGAKLDFDPYSAEQKSAIDRAIGSAIDRLREANLKLPPYAANFTL
ncbi:sialate:O-sulfotransferase 2-like [Diadema setosum]|uniref:sialate:O-sulfotransferase 2-like n=1 Tax=Diadema setosum TaxID=31175 RepID=UPI003B3AF4C4